MASFRAQYGIKLSSDLPTMKWREFAAYMSGLDGKTPLGRIISIRAEKDSEVLMQFTPEQKRIHDKWAIRKARKMPKEDVDMVIEGLRRTFLRMAGIAVDSTGEKTQEYGGKTETAETVLP